MRTAVCLFVVTLLAARAAVAQESGGEVEVQKPPPRPAIGWSGELVDPIALTRFHLTTRGVFANKTAFALEGRAQLRITEGFALSATLPIAIGDSDGGLGNLSAGATFATTFGDHATGVDVGGGLDVYAPTATANVGDGLVAALRAYEPMLYVQDLLSFRARGYFAYRTPDFHAALELGLVPGFYLEGSGDAVLLLSAAGRVGATLGVFEPYLEVGAAPQIAGVGEIAPPLLVTPGVRLHIGEIFDPALFVSFNFATASAVIVGLDLAVVIRPSERNRLEKSYDDDFLDDF